MKKIKFLFVGWVALTFVACHDDLNQDPIDPDSFTEVDVYNSVTEARGALAKVYAGLVLTGQKGPDGAPDIDGSIIDEGFSQYTRTLFNLNELTTDNCVVGWGDAGLPNLHEMSWGVNNPFSKAMYYRLSQVITFSNSFIENAATLAESDSTVAEYVAEARFIRAYAYFQLMDLFGNVPLVKELTTELPSQATRTELFAFVEQELLALESALPAAQSVDYGRVDRIAASALLTRLYLNAEVYTGTNRYADVITKAETVMNSSYAINTTDGNGNGSAYDELFLADNHANGAHNEFIFVLQFDGLNTQTWGGATFMTHAPVGGNMDPSKFGINGGWGGYRTTKGLVDKFDYAVTTRNGKGEPTAWSDSRANFFTEGQNYEIAKVPPFADGYAVMKYRNVDVNGVAGKDSSGNHVDTDIPIIRLAEVYLNYAEAVARGGGGSTGTATSLINELRNRAGAPTVSSGDITKDFVMDERNRELYWEMLRRPDLIRDGKFVTDAYLWPFKAGVAGGRASESHRKIYPIPENVLLVNKNLKQNPDY